MTGITVGGQDVKVLLVLKYKFPQRDSPVDPCNSVMQYGVERDIEGLDLTDG